MNSATKKKILFVDDDDDLRGRVSTSLTEAGFEPVAARDATEAMLRAEQLNLGLIIVDDDLAGESGLMLTKFLRHNHPGVPTMLYTTRTYDDSTVLDMMNQGADQCLPKGSMEELIVTVSCYVR